MREIDHIASSVAHRDKRTLQRQSNARVPRWTCWLVLWGLILSMDALLGLAIYGVWRLLN